MLLPGSHPLNVMGTPEHLVSQVVLAETTVVQNPNDGTDTHELVERACDEEASDVSGGVSFKVGMGEVKKPVAGGKMILAIRYITST